MTHSIRFKTVPAMRFDPATITVSYTGHDGVKRGAGKLHNFELAIRQGEDHRFYNLCRDDVLRLRKILGYFLEDTKA